MNLLAYCRLLIVLFAFFSTSSYAQTNAGVDETICFGQAPYTLSGFSPAGGTWSGTGVSPTGVFTPAGTGTFILIYTQGGNSDTKTVVVTQPVANFSLNPSDGCAIPHTVFFTDQSTLPDTWFWDFGDGNTSTAQNPVHSYTSAGDFIVTLVVTDTINGCSSSATDQVSVSIVSADYTISNGFGCGPLTVSFTDLSNVSGSGSIVSWGWDFGDGTTSAQTNPTHTYDTPGVYTPELSVTSSNGCTSMYSITNGVKVIGPDVNFGGDALSAQCTPHTVNFMDSTIFGAPITSWNWSFGDGNTSNMQNPSHQYQTSGNFDVSLTVTDIDGCSRTLSFADYVVIEDTTDPVITCPTDLTLSTDAGVCSVTNPSIGTPVVTDNCTIASTVNDLPTTLFPGVTSVTWTTSDDTGLTATCVQTITVLDESTSSILNETACDSYTTPSGSILTSSGSYLDVIPNAAGCDSNITINLDMNFSFFQTVTAVGCGSYISGSGQTYTTTGTFTEMLQTSAGCDSTVTLNITVENLDVSVSQNETTLTANWAGAETYQWINCSDNSLIVGETGQSYITFTNGDYAVIVSSPNCIDTSVCVTVNSAFLDDLEMQPIFLYPNPSSSEGEVSVFFDGEIKSIHVIDVLGRPVEAPTDAQLGVVKTNRLKPGNYFVYVESELGVVVLDLIISKGL